MNEPAIKRLLAVDGYALIYRSYFAFIHRPITDSQGRNVSAVFGFFRTLFSVLKQYEPDFLVVAMDSLTPTFRHTVYPEYKATREKTPEELHTQIPLIEEALEKAGVRMVRENGLEADDLIASIASSCRDHSCECLILSGDKDLMQLVDEGVFMLRPGKGEQEFFDRDAVYRHFSVYPEQIVDYLALIGDSSDNVPGVKGIGPKGAVKLLEEYADLDGIYAAVDRIAGGTAGKLRSQRELAYLSRDLVTLRRDSSCAQLPLKECSAEQIDWSKAVPVFTAIQSASLVEAAGGGAEKARAAKKGSNALQLDFPVDDELQQSSTGDALPALSGAGTYEAVTSLERLEAVLEEAGRAGIAAVDVETDSLDEMIARPVGFSIAWEPLKGCYIPLKAGGADILPEEAVFTRLKRFLEDPKLRIVGQHCKYDYKVLSRWGICLQAPYFDTLIAAWLLDSASASYGMDRLAAVYLDYTTLRFEEVVPKGGLFANVQLDTAVRYAAEDADITYRLYLLFSQMLSERGLDGVMHTLEMPLVKVLADMELRGMRILPEQLEEYAEELKERLAVIQERIFSECGHEFNINSTVQLQQVLFEERGLQPVKKTKTGYSTNVAVLEELARQDVVPSLILEHRSLEKLRNTYVEALPALINPRTGRIHTTLVQTGTATGRLASRNPNLQNIPIRSGDGRRIRSAFVPKEGSTFVSADYAQIELVVLAHYSDDPGLKEAFLRGTDVHRYTGALIFGVAEEQVTSEQRRIAKTINFGVMYGMSAFRLSQELGISRSDAAAFIEAYFARYSGVRRYMDSVVAEAEKSGRVTTLLGHERIVAGISSRNRTEKAGAERIAVNTPIQGSAADIMKLAMLAVDREISKRGLETAIVLQVHDELILEVPDDEVDEVKEMVRQVMEQAAELRVPLKVSVETGSSWGDMH